MFGRSSVAEFACSRQKGVLLHALSLAASYLSCSAVKLCCMIRQRARPDKQFVPCWKTVGLIDTSLDLNISYDYRPIEPDMGRTFGPEHLSEIGLSGGEYTCNTRCLWRDSGSLYSVGYLVPVVRYSTEPFRIDIFQGVGLVFGIVPVSLYTAFVPG